MFDNIEDVKKFILWAKKKKLTKIKLGNLEFEVSELDYIDDIKTSPKLSGTNTEVLSDLEELSEEEEEKLLYYSAGN